jgi:hypothetical protein
LKMTFHRNTDTNQQIDHSRFDSLIDGMRGAMKKAKLREKHVTSALSPIRCGGARYGVESVDEDDDCFAVAPPATLRKSGTSS